MKRFNSFLIIAMILLSPISASAQEYTGYTSITNTGISGKHTINLADYVDASHVDVNVTRENITHDYYITPDISTTYIQDSIGAGEENLYFAEKTSGYSHNGSAVLLEYYDASGSSVDSSVWDVYTESGCTVTEHDGYIDVYTPQTTNRNA